MIGYKRSTSERQSLSEVKITVAAAFDGAEKRH